MCLLFYSKAQGLSMLAVSTFSSDVLPSVNSDRSLLWEVGHSVEGVANSLDELAVCIPAAMAMTTSPWDRERRGWRKRLADVHTWSHIVPLNIESLLCCGSPLVSIYITHESSHVLCQFGVFHLLIFLQTPL